jgi:hypothetical protein
MREAELSTYQGTEGPGAPRLLQRCNGEPWQIAPLCTTSGHRDRARRESITNINKYTNKSNARRITQTTLDLADMYLIQGHFLGCFYAPNQEDSANQAQKANSRQSISQAAAQHAHTNAKLENGSEMPRSAPGGINRGVHIPQLPML